MTISDGPRSEIRTANTQAPLISIVVPAYDAAAYLPETLASIAGQEFRDFECVVVDDGSADDTLAIASGWAADDRRFRFITKQNGGASSARNAGFRALHPGSTFITFMDADDRWLPHALARLRANAERNPACIGSHGLADFIDSEGNAVAPGEYAAIGRHRLGRRQRRLAALEPSEPTTFEVLINGNVLFPPGLLLVRRSAYEAAGPFDETFNGPEDWDMLIRLSRVGPIEFADEVILEYRRHDRNLGAGPHVARQAWLVRCKAFYSIENTPEQQRSARLGWRAYQRLLAKEAWVEAKTHLSHRRVRLAFSRCARLLLIGSRFLKGRPSPRLETASLRW